MKRNKGIVLNISGNKTARVIIHNKVTHPKYNVSMQISKKYLIHDEKNILKKGDYIEFVSCAPISKKKYYILQNIIKN